MHAYDRDDPNFERMLKESAKPVRVIARYLRDMGLSVTIPKTRVRPDPSVMSEYADDGDLIVSVKGRRLRLEVKQRLGDKQQFTGPHDHIFSSVMVDAIHHFNRADPKPHTYFILNREMTDLITINVRRTRPHWTKLHYYDKAKKRWRWSYMCPIELVKFTHLKGENRGN